MEASRVAPMVLRLGRQRLRGAAGSLRFPHRINHIRSLTASTRLHAVPLPPSPEEARAHSDASSSQPPPRPDSEEIPAAPPSPKRSLRPYLWASAFILIGVFGSGMMRAIAFPPPLPEPGTEEDEYLVSRYRNELNNLPIVSELRKDRGAWREYDPYSQREAYISGSAADADAVERHMTAGSLRGARGLAVQRSFYNAAERREITIMFFGGAASGWPGVTHGGVLATVLKEAVERAASGPGFASRESVVTGGAEGGGVGGAAAGGPKRRFDCETLNLAYKKPTQANNFYVIRAEVVDGDGTKPGAVAVKATIEKLDGTVTVATKATCVPSTVAGQGLQAAKDEAASVWSGLTSVFGGGSSSNA